MEDFVRQIGYDPVLFEKGDIPFRHDQLLEQSCVKEVEASDVLILVIGGRYGSLSREDQEVLEANPDSFFGKIRSITQKEYDRARERDIPIFAFVDSQVMAEYHTYRVNKDKTNINYAFVDNIRIYELIDFIYAQRRNNYLKEFTKIEDITIWLREQWAGLFSDFLRQKTNITRFKNLEEQLDQLDQLVKTLTAYNEAILKAVNQEQSSRIISTQRKLNIKRIAERLMTESMVSYLLEKYKIEKKPETIWAAFEAATTLESFLYKILERDQVENFLKDFEDEGRRDFVKYQRKYFPLRDIDTIDAHDEFNPETK